MKKRPFVVLKNSHFSYGARGFYKMVRDIRDKLDYRNAIVLDGYIGEIHNKIGVLAYKNIYDFGEYSVIQKTIAVGYEDKNGTIHNMVKYVFEYWEDTI